MRVFKQKACQEYSCRQEERSIACHCVRAQVKQIWNESTA